MTQLYPENLSYVRAKREVTYGADPTLADSDLIYAEDVDMVAKYTNADRPGQTSHAPGLRGVKTAYDGPISLTTEVGVVTITDGNSLPLEDPILYACGFTPTASVGGDNKTQTYVRQSGVHGSMACDWTLRNDANDDCIRIAQFGVRGDWTLTIPGSDKWLFKMEGNSSSGSEARTNAAAGSIDFDGNICAIPVIGGTNIASILVYDGDANIAGISPLIVHNAEFTGNMGVNPVQGVNGRQVRLVPGYLGGKITIDIGDLDDFDPRDLQDQGKVILVTIYSSDLTWTDLTPAVEGSYVIFRGSFTIRDCSMSTEGGRRVWELDLRGAYPEASSDNGGLDPDENGRIIYGTYEAS